MNQRAPRRILAVKIGGLGETLTVTPALRALRETFPGTEVHGLTSAVGAEALIGTGLLDRTFEATVPVAGIRDKPPVGALLQLGRSLRPNRYDRVVIFHHLLTRRHAAAFGALALAAGGRRAGLDNGRGKFLQDRAADYGYGARHEVEYWLDVAAALGARTANPRLAIARTPAADARAETWLSDLDRPRLAIQAGGGSFGAARRWPVKGFVEVAERVRRVFGASIVLVGSPADQPLHEEVLARLGPPIRDLTGQTSVVELAGVLARCDVLLANHSGVMHAGAAVGVPTVAVFGPSNHEAWGPWTGEPDDEGAESPSGLTISLPPTTVVRSEIACSPCFYVGKELGTPEGCPARTCLTTDVTPAQVGQAVSRYLGARKRALRVTSG